MKLWWHVLGSLVPRHQIFRARPAALLKNRVWTLSLRKLGQVYIQWSVNWVLVTLSATSIVCFGAKKFASWVFVMMHNAFYFTWAISLVRQHADILVWLRPKFTSERVQTLFSDKSAGHVWKIWSGDKTMWWVAARCATEAFSTTCVVNIEECEDWSQWSETGSWSWVWIHLSNCCVCYH